MYHTQITRTIFCPQWRSQGWIHFLSLFFVWQDRCEEFLHQMQWVRHNHFSVFLRESKGCGLVLWQKYHPDHRQYRDGRVHQAQVWGVRCVETDPSGREGGKESPHIVHSKTEATRWWDTERAPGHCCRTAAIRGVWASQAVKIYSQVQLLFPTLIKSINVFHFSRNCEVIHQLIMY